MFIDRHESAPISSLSAIEESFIVLPRVFAVVIDVFFASTLTIHFLFSTYHALCIRFCPSISTCLCAFETYTYLD